MTTVNLLRTTWVNGFLGRAEGQTDPWTDGEVSQRITDALTQLWADGIGKRVSGTASPTESTDVYTIPSALQPGRISRIELEQNTGGISARIDQLTSWQYYSDTQVRIRPRLPTDSSLTLRFFGWAPFDITGSDLPTRLENAVAMKAAGLAFGQMTGDLVNAQTQQGIDSGRVIDYQTAAGLSAYWERRYQEIVRRDPARISLSPRRASR